MRLRAALLGTALALGAVPACSSDPGPAKAPRTFTLPAEKVRDGETPLQGKTGRSADLEYTVLGFHDGMNEVLGTHAAMGAKGRFVRVRVLATNKGRDIQVFDLWKQRLVTADGRAHDADMNATMVKRQPERLSVGAAMRAEFDLFFDVPRDAKVKSIRLIGSPTVGAVSDPPPADIALP